MRPNCQALRSLEPAAALPPNDHDMPNSERNLKRRNWIVLVVLAAAAAFIYASFIYKMHG